MVEPAHEASEGCCFVHEIVVEGFLAVAPPLKLFGADTQFASLRNMQYVTF